MKIVITNPSGLTAPQLDALKTLGDVHAYSSTNASNYAERLKDADIAVIDCFLTPVTKDFLSSTPNLKFFSINSTGYDNVDVDALRDTGVVASNVPEFSTDSVAELAIRLMFASVRKIALGDKEFREGFFEVDPGTPAAARYMGFNLREKTIGIIGLGHIGTRVAEITHGIGMHIVGYNRTPKQIPNVDLVPLETLMRSADVVVVCLAKTKETEGLLSRELIASMKKTAVLVSIAGMSILDKAALIEALNSDMISGAGLDTADATMLSAKNVVFTPHIGYDTTESNENMGRIIVENIQAFIAGKPINLM